MPPTLFVASSGLYGLDAPFVPGAYTMPVVVVRISMRQRFAASAGSGEPRIGRPNSSITGTTLPTYSDPTIPPRLSSANKNAPARRSPLIQGRHLFRM